MSFSGPLYKVLHRKKGEVEHLVTQTRELKQFTRLLQAELDSSLAPHFHVARLTPTQLTIVVDSPAWATRLRFQPTTLLRQLAKKHHIGQASQNGTTRGHRISRLQELPVPGNQPRS